MKGVLERIEYVLVYVWVCVCVLLPAELYQEGKTVMASKVMKIIMLQDLIRASELLAIVVNFNSLMFKYYTVGDICDLFEH